MKLQMRSLGRGASSAASVVMLIVALIAVNVIASLLPYQIDVTEEGIYTLSAGTKRILADLQEPATIKFYFSQDVPGVQVAIKTYGQKVRELLRKYESASGGKLRLEVYNPKPDSDEQEWATRYGLQAPTLPQGDRFFFGVVVLSEDREATIPFLDPRRQRFLEYDLSEAITRASQVKRPKVGLLSYLPISGSRGSPMSGPTPPWAVAQELRKSYEVVYISPNETAFDEDLALLVVILPKNVPDKVSYALDQFLLRGGRMIVAVDPNSRLDPAQGGAMFTMGGGSSLPKLFAAWGVKFDSDKIVGDLALATRVNAGADGLVEFPLWISAGSAQFNHDSVITSNLEEMILIDSGALEVGADFKYKFTPLISTSKDSGTVESMMARFAGPLELSKSLKTDGKSRVLAAMINGKFASAFPDGPPPADKDDKGGDPPKAKEEAKAQSKPTKPHLAQAERDTSVFIIGDADFLGDQFSVREVNFFGQRVQQPINDNLAFFLNTVEFALGNQNLINIRSRGQLSRPFTRVQELQAQAQRRYQQEEQKLSERLEEVRNKLKVLEGETGGGKQPILSPTIVDEIQKFRAEEQHTRSALREVRKVLRQDIESLGNRLLLINLLLVPVLVAIVGFVVILRRAKRKGGKP